MKYFEFYKKAQESLITAFNSMYAAGNQQAADYFKHLLTEVEEEKILREPVFQTVFPWECTDKTFGDMDQLLGTSFVDAVSTAQFKDPANPGVVEPMGFGGNKGRASKPFKHQITAWEAVLNRHKSIVITTGTGSGKTESFMIPILKELYDDRCNANGANPGVEAIFLYPLNALIASQRKRIHAWCDALPDKVTYGIYTGDALESQAQASKYEPQIIDRYGIRTNPPQILFSNPTMLEYMMVRAKDQSILQQSPNLKWIVLDEAHTYTGSAAAELALQIRRILKLFGKEPKDVNFAIASATIGRNMKDFLEKLTGKNYNDFEFIEGRRVIPQLDVNSAQNRINSINSEFGTNITYQQIENLRIELNKSESMTAAQRAQLPSDPDEKKALSAQDICDILGIPGFSLEQQLGIVDRLSEQDSVDNLDSSIDTARALLPVRAHFFIRGIKGVYAFRNPKEDSVIAPLPIGHITTSDTPSARVGNSTMLHVLRCKKCGEYMLEGEEVRPTGFGRPSTFRPADHSLVLDSIFNNDDNDDDGTDGNNTIIVGGSGKPFALAATALSAPSSRYRVYNVDLDFFSNTFKRNQGNIYVDCRNNNGNLPSCPNCGAGSKDWQKLIFSANQISRILAHLLLEEAPIDKDPSHKQKIYDGRKLITFTDNRARTASFAKGMNNEIEREWCRSAIYHDLHEKTTITQGQLTPMEEMLLNMLENKEVLTPIEENTKNELIARRDIPQINYAHLTWSDFKNAHHADTTLGNLYNTIGSNRLTNRNSQDDYLQAVFFDAMAMRPLYATSLESLGLVHYEFPEVEALQANSVPQEFRDYFSYDPSDSPKMLEDWKNLLRITIDYEIRRNSHIFIPTNLRDILSQRFYSDSLYSSRIYGWEDSHNRKYKTFPQIRNFGNGATPQIGRLALMLLFGRGIHDENQLTLSIVNETNALLNKIWTELIRLNVLTDTHEMAENDQDQETGYKIDLCQGVNPASCPRLVLTTKVNECPVTHYYIDCDFRGISPTVMGELSFKNYSRYKLKTPYVDVPFCPVFDRDYPQQPDVVRQQYEEWYNKEYLEAVGTAGIALNIRHNIMLPRPIFTTQEHSAQISSKKLRESEHSFEEGRLNILSCSTTMEMGVDIGGISIVQMNNIPPKPANYLQRTGRAGRRTETQSIAVTICNDDPIGHLAIDNPMWPFDHEIASPTINMSSATIVQRHVNSLLLGEYLRTYSPHMTGINISSQIGAFIRGHIYDDPAQTIPYTYNNFGVELNGYHSDNNIKAKIQSIIAGTGLDGISIDAIISECEKTINDVCSKCDAEITYLESLIQRLQAASGSSVQINRNKFALRSIWTKNMISYLAENNFLPSSNIPNNVAALEIDEKYAKKAYDQTDKANPQRPLHLAINEYAPGKEVVVSNVVYPVEGIRMDGDIMNGNSSIRYLAYCPTCRQIKTANTLFHNCPDCNSTLNPVLGYQSAPTKMIQPNGFIGGEPSRSKKPESVHHRTEPTLIGMRQWSTTVDSVYSIRVSDPKHSEILFINKGNGYGFALCEYCGKMKPETKFEGDPNYQSPFGSVHLDIRSGKQCDIQTYNGSVKHNVVLSAQIPTDIAELNIATDLVGDEKVCLLHTLGTVISRVFAQLLGIDDDELDYGLTSQETLFIYDTSAGGAGYSCQLPNYIEKVLDESLCRLVNHNCKKACTRCLIDSRSNIYRDYLDKGLAIDWLQAELNSRQDIPASVQNMFPGETVRKVTKDINTELFNRLSDASSASYFMGDDPAKEFMDDKLTPCFSKLMFSGKQVTPVVNSMANLNFSQKLCLITLESKYGRLAQVKSVPQVEKPLIYVEDASTTYFYFKEGDAYYYAIGTSVLALVPCSAPHIDPSTTSIFINKVVAPSTTTRSYLDMVLGKNAHALNNFMTQLATQRPVMVHYTDIYLSSPGSCILLGQFVATLLARYGLNPVKILVSTSRVLDSKDDTYMNGSFLSVTERNDYLEDCINASLQDVGIDVVDGVEIKCDGKLPHSRLLRICNADFELEINPDGGIMQGWEYVWGTYAPHNDKDMVLDYDLKNTQIQHYNAIRYTIGWTKR